MHPQTLRQYDRLGLVTPQRTKGGGRRYSPADIRRLREIQRLSHDEGVNLAGISRIMELERDNDRLRREVDGLRSVLDHLASLRTRVFAADAGGGVTEYSRGERPREPRALVRYSRASQALVLVPRTPRAPVHRDDAEERFR
ncbi:heat shock protein transcriptional repressor HspR [Nanchangia anserum]|nr:MerR family transcriptional regulator [Nanchangia anserum]